MTLVIFIQVITSQSRPVLFLRYGGTYQQRIRRLYVVIIETCRKNATCTLRQIEVWKKIFLLRSLWVVHIKNASSHSRSHFSAVVSVQSQGSSLTNCLVATRELTETTSSKDRWISCLEVLVDNQATIVDKTIVVNGMEDILIDILVARCDK